jgi:hypothetical protein
MEYVTDQQTHHDINEVSKRAWYLYQKHGHVADMLSIQMDLEFCHANGCNLDFARMLAGSDYDLLHDVSGINAHIDRKTGQLQHGFLPRFAA